MGNKYRADSPGSDGGTRAEHANRDDGTDDAVRDRADRTVQDAIADATTRTDTPGDVDDSELPTVAADSALNDIEIGDELDDFEVFVVGGAVRDDLREGDRPPDDIDLMAVPRPEAEIDDPVDELDDRDRLRTVDAEDAFPVFLDSEGREVALPRTEESTGAGFKAFDVTLVPPDTPVEEAVSTDLERRDLRYNALAYNPESGELHDPHGGREDLRDGRVRHVSEAFAEDPVRVLRMSRFAARFDHDVDEDTRVLAREVAPDLEAVPGDRTRMEMEKAFKQADDPRRFFDEARKVGALRVALPEVESLAADSSDERAGIAVESDTGTAADTATGAGVATGTETGDGGDGGTRADSADTADGVDAYERTMETISTVHEYSPNDRGGMFAALGRHMGESSPDDPGTDAGAGADDDTEVGERSIRGLADRVGMDGEAERTMLASHRLGNDVDALGSGDVEDEEVVGLVERLDGDRTGMYTPETAIDVASVNDDFDRERAERRVERARDAIESVDGGTVFQAEDLSPEDIGEDGELTGAEFGDLIDRYRVEEYGRRDESE